jgi:hypothetical protein
VYQDFNGLCRRIAHKGSTLKPNGTLVLIVENVDIIQGKNNPYRAFPARETLSLLLIFRINSVTNRKTNEFGQHTKLSSIQNSIVYIQSHKHLLKALHCSFYSLAI